MKKFICAVLMGGILFTGCGTKITPPKENPKQVEEKVEPSAEEKARIEAEKAEAAKIQAEQRRQKIQEMQARKEDLLNNGVYFDYSFEKIANKSYKVTVKTNLPDGTILKVHLTNYFLLRRERGIGDEEMDVSIPEHARIQKEVKAISFRQGEEITLSGGEFTLAFKGDRLNPGDYEFVIQSLVSFRQPKAVRDVIGKNGENLFGQGVIDTGTDKQVRLEDIVYLP